MFIPFINYISNSYYFEKVFQLLFLLDLHNLPIIANANDIRQVVIRNTPSVNRTGHARCLNALFVLGPFPGVKLRILKRTFNLIFTP
ncbi:MAG: hypothetical protein D4R67_05270 [Bacteroidetes bacterium]|nr:MAG: hypothetical protein D4R67_05270 [Bacteroidota bacterium]